MLAIMSTKVNPADAIRSPSSAVYSDIAKSWRTSCDGLAVSLENVLPTNIAKRKSFD